MLDKNILAQNIITALGIQSLPDERKAALIDKMAKLVEKNLLVRLLQGLSEQDCQEFDKIGDNDEEGKMKFLQAKFPNMEEMMLEEIVKVKQAVLEAGKID